MMQLIDFEHDSAGNLIGVTVDYDGERIELERVQHGEWIEHPTIFKYISHWECSACNSWHGERGMNYCPNCGAKMDGGKQDG